jgi:tetratricopeptide (TPR) repeat protein
MLQIPWKLLITALLLCIVPGKAIWLSAQEDTDTNNVEVVANEANNEIKLADKDSPLLVEPEGPEELFKSAFLMYRLGRLDLSKQYFQKLISDNPGDDVLLSLRDEYGPAVFLKLSRIDEVQVYTKTLLTKINQAFVNQAMNPGRVDKLLGMLVQDTADRAQILEDLHAAGPFAVPRIILLLQQDLSHSDRVHYIQALTYLGKQALPPIIGSLETTNESLKSEMVSAIGRVGSLKEAAFLWYPAFSEDSPTGIRQSALEALSNIYKTELDKVQSITQANVVAELEKLTKTYFMREISWATDENGLVTYWKWDPAKRTVFINKIKPERATVILGKHFSGQLVDIDPENNDAQAIFMGFALESDRLNQGEDELPSGPGTALNLAYSTGSKVIKRTLKLSLQSKQIQTAVTALRVLSHTATPHDLHTTGKNHSVILEALNYPNPMIQFEAADTILKLAPKKHFSGSSRIVSILSRTLNDSGIAACVVVDPNTVRGNEMASLLRESNYQSDVLPHGREGFRLAAERGNIEFALLHMNTIRWNLSQTITNFRADSRTSGIPIFIYGPESGKHKVISLLTRYEQVHYLVQVTSKENLDPQLKPFVSLFSGNHIPQDQRRMMMKKAVTLLKNISNEKLTHLFPLHPAERALHLALQDQELVLDALEALSSIPSRETQNALQQLVINRNLPKDQRLLAATILGNHIQKHSLLLTNKDVLAVKILWKQESDPQIANALSSIMGILQPNSSRVGTRLKKYLEKDLDSKFNSAN